MKIDTNTTSLWSLGIAPVVWAIHTLVCYVLAAVWCAKFGRAADLSLVRMAIFTFTALAAIIILYQMIKFYRQHRVGDSPLPHDDDTPEDRERFLGFANFLISCLSLVAICFVGFNAVIFRSCH